MELVINSLTKTFETGKAVNQVSFQMSSGVYGLLGINGAGKTTLMRMITTLMRPTAGQILLNGQDIFKLGGEYRKLLGYLPQDFGYYPNFTLTDYLLYIASIKGMKPSVARRRAKELIAQVGLAKQANTKMRKFSGGMKRRAGIAQAMLNDPSILILDEPTAGLDPNERIRFRNLLSELSADRIVLLSTHIVSDVEYIAGEILLMKDGVLTMSGTVEELIAAMEEKVWRLVCTKKQANEYLKSYKTVNVKLINNHQAELRLLSAHRPVSDAEQVEASLEDLFLYHFGERMEEADVEV